MHRSNLILMAFVLWSVSAVRTTAQWVDQAVVLRPGWNAVQLEVQPAPAECDAVFAGLPIESVWAWNRRAGRVQFIQDPSSLIPPQPDWLTWLPPIHPLAKLVSLFSLEGGRSYLVKVADSSTALTLKLRGIPSLRKVEWIPDSLNFAGFSVSAATPVTFQDFFVSSAAHNASTIYRLNSAGYWETVGSPSSTTLQAGEAFWIQTRGASAFQGPISLTLPFHDGLRYGRSLVEQTLRIRNLSLRPVTVRLKKLSSATPPSRNQPALAGEVPLYYWKFDPANNVAGWTLLPPELTVTNLPAGQEWQLRLEVRRTEMSPFVLPVGASQPLYQSLLEISDSLGAARLLVPVTAEGLSGAGAAAGVGLLSTRSSPAGAPRHAGLWVGTAVLDRVNQPAALVEPDKVLAAAGEFQFRLLVHVDDAGKAKLLQKVLLMWKEGAYAADPKEPNKRIVSEPGRYVLVTDDSKIQDFSGAALRDGRQVGRRFSSAAFGFSRPIPLSGAGEFGGGAFTCLVPLGYDDPLNPFKHRYHPDHDNLDETFKQKLGAGRESYDVGRRITLEFTPNDPHNLSLAGWGDSQIGGIYREAISGLHKGTIFLQGTFRLQRATRVSVLNDGLP